MSFANFRIVAINLALIGNLLASKLVAVLMIVSNGVGEFDPLNDLSALDMKHFLELNQSREIPPEGGYLVPGAHRMMYNLGETLRKGLPELF